MEFKFVDVTLAMKHSMKNGINIQIIDGCDAFHIQSRNNSINRHYPLIYYLRTCRNNILLIILAVFMMRITGANVMNIYDFFRSVFLLFKVILLVCCLKRTIWFMYFFKISHSLKYKNKYGTIKTNSIFKCTFNKRTLYVSYSF